LQIIKDCSTIFRPNIYQVFLVDNWKKFSNHGGNFANVETVHDSLHISVSGRGGHMGHPDIAAFDPLFFLHHCNVDRFVAIWQACHPDVWIEEDNKTDGTFTDAPGGKIDADTDLTPFRKSDTEFWNSNDVR
jgi:tyrosinase